MNTPIIIQAEHLTKQVMSGNLPLTILDDINLTIRRRAIIAITGASGSGKSTLLSLLAGLDLPTQGHVLLNGQNLNQLTEDGRALLRANNVGFVFQAFQLLPHLTALENVLLPLELANQSNAYATALQLLTEVNLSARAHHYPKQLSGGEQQRVAIARAFATKPSILFADEVTGNLDQKTGEQIIDLLLALNQQHNTTLLLVTHDKTLADRCHERFILERGKLMN